MMIFSFLHIPDAHLWQSLDGTRIYPAEEYQLEELYSLFIIQLPPKKVYLVHLLNQLPIKTHILATSFSISSLVFFPGLDTSITVGPMTICQCSEVFLSSSAQTWQQKTMLLQKGQATRTGPREYLELVLNQHMAQWEPLQKPCTKISRAHCSLKIRVHRPKF